MWAHSPRLRVNPGVMSDEWGWMKAGVSLMLRLTNHGIKAIAYRSSCFLFRSYGGQPFYVSLPGSVNRTLGTVLGCWASEQTKQRPPHLGARQLAHSDIASSPSLLSHPFSLGSTLPQQFEKSLCLVAGVTPMIQVPPYRFIALSRVSGCRSSRFAR